MNLSELINPLREDGGIDHRYSGLAKQIVELAGNDCIKDLASFYQYTNDAEARFEKAGLTLVSSFFQIEMERWQQNSFKKRLRECLEEIGFRPSKITRLLTAGEFVAGELKDQSKCSSWEWFDCQDAANAYRDQSIKYLYSHGVTALYHLARMNWKGQVKARNSYDYDLGKPLSVRELEKLQRQHPADNRGQQGRRGRTKPRTDQTANSTLPPVSESADPGDVVTVITDVEHLDPATDTHAATTTELVEQLVSLVKAIDWSTIKDHQEAMDNLSSVEYTWSQISEAVDDWKYLPLTLTHA